MKCWWFIIKEEGKVLTIKELGIVLLLMVGSLTVVGLVNLYLK
jgi:hypothetical protein